MTYPDAHVVNYDHHDGSGLIDSVWSSSVTYAAFSSYKPSGKIGIIDYGNGVTTTYDYYPDSTRLSSIVTKDINQATILNRAYTYEPSGDIQSITEGSTTYTYYYDNLHRLVREKQGFWDTATYSYNAIGNITSKTGFPFALNYTAYDATHKHAVRTINIASTDYTHVYDANGNMTSGWDFSSPYSPVSRTISYNAENMPTSISRGGVTATTYSYDGNGKRVKKTTPAFPFASTTYYVGEHFEAIGMGPPTRYVFAGNLRIARESIAGGTLYYHKDHLGSSTAMTDSSGIGAYGTSNYMPFGSMRSTTGSSGSSYKFTDQELDSESGLYNYNARLYDPYLITITDNWTHIYTQWIIRRSIENELRLNTPTWNIPNPNSSSPTGTSAGNSSSAGAPAGNASPTGASTENASPTDVSVSPNPRSPASESHSCEGTWKQKGSDRLPLNTCVGYYLCEPCDSPVLWGGRYRTLPRKLGIYIYQGGDPERGDRCFGMKPGAETGCD